MPNGVYNITATFNLAKLDGDFDYDGCSFENLKPPPAPQAPRFLVEVTDGRLTLESRELPRDPRSLSNHQGGCQRLNQFTMERVADTMPSVW